MVGVAGLEPFPVVPAPACGDSNGTSITGFKHISQGIAHVPQFCGLVTCAKAAEFLYFTGFAVGANNILDSGHAMGLHKVTGGIRNVRSDHIRGVGLDQLGDQIGNSGKGSDAVIQSGDAGSQSFSQATQF